MFAGAANADKTIDRIIADLGDHALMKSHARHLSAAKCREMGLVVEALEDDSTLQDLVLTLHHACIHTLAGTPAVKIIENQNAVAFIQVAQTVLVRGPSALAPEQSDAQEAAPVRERVEELAHELWMRRGCPENDGLADWLEAERQIGS
jgi:hypothetical protein